MIKPNDKILTGVDADKANDEYPISDSLRQKLVYFENGILWVSDSYKRDREVLAFVDLISRDYKKRFKKVEYVPFIEINQAYQGDDSDNRDTSHTQQEVVKRIKDAVSQNASDIHFIIKKGSCDLRYRIDGVIRTVEVLSEQHGKDLVSTIYQSMCDVTSETTLIPNQPQDGKMSSDYLKECGLFGSRYASRPTDVNYMVVLRLLYDRDHTHDLRHLGYTDEQVEKLENMLSRTSGVNFISGETGSGKSTTLECLMTIKIELENGNINLITIEDPPEYEIKGANQTPLQCDRDDPDSISQAWVRSISNCMRLDPDCLMIGETRDAQSARAAIQGAMTGHPIWTTVHANDAVFILKRLEDMGVDIGLIADPKLITGLVNQSLIPKLCPECKVPYNENKGRLKKGLQQRIQQVGLKESNIYLAGCGCKNCNNTGIKGRTVVAEMIIPDVNFMRIYRERGTADARQYWVKSLNGVTKCQHLLQLIESGLVDPEIAERMILPLNEDLLSIDGVSDESFKKVAHL